MNSIYLINVESFKLTVNEALAMVETEIDSLRLLNKHVVLKVVHGYGSSGSGGEIKKHLPIFLSQLKAKNKIIDFVSNSSFSSLNQKYKTYTKMFPELVLDKDLANLNPGITLIFL
ncbi:MAG: hypothetical protein IJD48_04200 [Clostridia bacterium]|nr:hypothetical protein [Clostridia bacterium]